MNNKNKIEIYKTITINRDDIDDKTIREWKKFEKIVKQAEKQFMDLQLAEDVKKMIKDFNDRGLGDETIQDKTQDQKDL